MSEITGKTQAGTFHVDGKDMFGELTVDGANSSLHLRDEESFDVRANRDGCIHGSLHDLKKVSLFDCICPGLGHASRNGQLYYFAEVFPHYVISGYQYLRPTDQIISAIHFVISDAGTLFYDFDAFGRVIHPEEHIDTIAQANRPNIRREVKTGSEPEIVYFTGKREIFKANTAIGSVSASHNPVTSSIGGPSGVYIRNTISVAINFHAHVNFETALDRLFALRRYFELIVGRQQTVLDVRLLLGDGSSVEQYLGVDCSMEVKREDAKGESKPHPTDTLLSPIDDPAQFGRLVSEYFARDEEWKTARVQFTSKLNQKYSYDVDRLIAMANVFDLLPESCFPSGRSVPDDLKQAGKKAREIFRALPQSPDRDSVLNAIGRIGKLSLKRKIASRVKVISDRTAAFPELAMVTEKAVNCRNYFVHGGDNQDFVYSDNYPVVWFLVDSLQFVFGASDLIEAGWDITAWLNKWTRMAHPFGKYKIEYSSNLPRLKSALSVVP